jgi:dienelactone hydrolase
MPGVPFVAAEPRIKAAVLGLCSFRGSSAVRGRIEGRHRQDAPNVACPIQFFVQLDDQQFDADGAIELFRALGTKDKRLLAYPGLHAEMPPEGSEASRAFLATRLKG